MAIPESRKRVSSPYLALCLAVLAAASMVYYHQAMFIPRSNAMLAARDLGNGYSFGNDFYQVWLSSRELLRHKVDPYCPEMTREIQTGLYGRPLDPNRLTDPVDRRVFPYPAFVDLLFWPAAEIPFSGVRIGVLLLLLGLTTISVPLWLRAMGWSMDWKWIAVTVLLTISSYPALEGLFAGQLGLLVAFLLAAAVAALKQNRFLAGILMALATIKPQVAALPIVYLLLWSIHEWAVRKKFVAGLSAGVFLLFATSLAVLPGWIKSWIRTVLVYRHYTTPSLITQVVTSLLPSPIAGTATLILTAAAIVAALILAWRNRNAGLESSAFWLTLSILLSITTVFILPGQAVYDHLILIPALLLLVRDRDQLQKAGSVPRLLLRIGAFVFVWPWMAAFALITMRPFIPRAVFESAAVFALPLRMAASLPFAILVLLVWNWRICRFGRQAVS